MKKHFLTVVVATLSFPGFGRELRPRNGYSDHMLFQRDQPVVFARYANPGESVGVKMNGASAKGDWKH